MSGRPPPQPAPRALTVREALRRRLREGPATAHELSIRTGIREREVADHLEHLARTLAVRGERLGMDPSCLDCGYVFRGRSRFSRPSACPRCRSTHIEPPAFRVEPPGG